MSPPPDLDALGRYNAEVSRGIMHTPEYDERMAELQSRFDAELHVGATLSDDGKLWIRFDPPKRRWWRR